MKERLAGGLQIPPAAQGQSGAQRKRAGNVVSYLQQACGWKPYRMLSPEGMSGSQAASARAMAKPRTAALLVNIMVSKGLDGL